MSASLNSTSGTKKKWTEELADLTLNHDEALDMQLALGALGGLRHSAACDATERSNRRYDDRNHRMHETRMKAMGMEGDEESEEGDMSQQVLIRSPIHNHYHYPANQPEAQPSPPPVPPQPVVTPLPVQPPAQGLSNFAKAALLSSAIGMGGLGAAAYALWNRGGDTVINNPIVPGDTVGIENMPAGPPHPDRSKFQVGGGT